MAQPESHAEIARMLLVEIRSLLYNFPEHAKNKFEVIKAALGTITQTQLLATAALGVILLVQLFLKFVRIIVFCLS